MLEQIQKQGAQQPEQAGGMSVIAGVQVYDLTLEAGEQFLIRKDLGNCEFLYCQEGTLQLHIGSTGRIGIHKHDILLLSDGCGIQWRKSVSGRFRGILVAVDTLRVQDSLDQLSSLLGGLELDMRQVIGQIQWDEGGALIRADAWNEALFAVLEELPGGERERYCAFKTAELFYLLKFKKAELNRLPFQYYYDRYQTDIMGQVNRYIHSHLMENLSIEKLAEQFRISPTMLKQCFRQIYGKPIHQYIAACRMERAEHLLSTTSLPVVQVAAEVGYCSASQFGVMFKRQYHVSPAQYRRRKKKV